MPVHAPDVLILAAQSPPIEESLPGHDAFSTVSPVWGAAHASGFRHGDRVRPDKGCRPILRVILYVVAALVVLGLIVVGGTYAYVSHKIGESYQVQAGTENVSLSSGQPFTLLVLGTTELSSGQKTLSTVVAASVNPRQDRTVFADLPASAKLPDGHSLEGIFAGQGTAGAIAEVSKILGVPVNKVVVVDVDSLGDFVAASGGVEIENAQAFRAGGYLFKAGSLRLTTADQVTAYFTQLDARDAFNVANRQSAVGMAVLQDMKVRDVLCRGPALLSAYSDNVTSDLSSNDFMNLARHYRQAFTSTDKINFHTQGSGNATVLTHEEITIDSAAFVASLK